MKTADLRSLQALRQLREQRAASQLAVQQQRCCNTRHALDDVREKLRLRREALAREAERLYGTFSDGLSISAWHAAQEYLNQLAGSRSQLEASVEQTARLLEVQEQEREVFQATRMARERQAEACDSLLKGRLQNERRAREFRDEADDIPAAGPRGIA